MFQRCCCSLSRSSWPGSTSKILRLSKYCFTDRGISLLSYIVLHLSGNIYVFRISELICLEREKKKRGAAAAGTFHVSNAKSFHRNIIYNFSDDIHFSQMTGNDDRAAFPSNFVSVYIYCVTAGLKELTLISFIFSQFLLRSSIEGKCHEYTDMKMRSTGVMNRSSSWMHKTSIVFIQRIFASFWGK